LRAGLTGLDGNDGKRERHQQSADDQGCVSGKVNGIPHLFSSAFRRKRNFQWGPFTIPAFPKQPVEFGNSAAQSRIAG
jgi:hypothetical protein